jgi:hypothetical protein
MANPIVRFFLQVFVERPARRLGAEGLIPRLDAAREAVPALLAGADDASARAQLRHVIGIERWGQRRLRVALGDVAFEADAHQPYLPPEDEALPALLDRFGAVRADTVALARRVADEGRGAERVEHNSLGPVTALGWLRYLQLHGEFELKRAKRAR